MMLLLEFSSPTDNYNNSIKKLNKKIKIEKHNY